MGCRVSESFTLHALGPWTSVPVRPHVLPINELCSNPAFSWINKHIRRYLRLHSSLLMLSPPNPPPICACACMCVSVLDYTDFSFSPSCLMPSAYLMLWVRRCQLDADFFINVCLCVSVWRHSLGLMSFNGTDEGSF